METKNLRQNLFPWSSYTTLVLVLTFLLLQPPLTRAQSQRIEDPALLATGKQLFQTNCSSCHGDLAQGIVTDWQKPGADGKYPAPPLNGTAHTWHHSISALAGTIQNGTIGLGGSMPAWKGKLSEDDTFAIIIWLTSLWPDEIYEAWMERNKQ